MKSYGAWLALAVFTAIATLLAATLPATAAADTHPTASKNAELCTPGAIADRVDPRPPDVYAAGWVSCTSDWPTHSVFVDLYRDGRIVASGHDTCDVRAGCDASTPVVEDALPGNQAWRTHVIVRTQACTCDAWSPVFHH